MRRALLAALLVICAVASGAQAPSPSEPAKGDTGKSIIDQELEPAPGGYTYNPQGRRDPFISLAKPVGVMGAKGARPAGIPGFLIQEVALKGVVKTSGGGMGVAQGAGYIAILQGTDGKSYFVTVGQRLFDGVIVSIDASSVSFRQEVTDPLSPVRSRDVRKTLYPSEEARQLEPSSHGRIWRPPWRPPFPGPQRPRSARPRPSPTSARRATSGPPA